MKKAYEVYNKDTERWVGIYFGETSGIAKQSYIELDADDDEIYLDLLAFRAPWADKYAKKGRVPALECLKRGCSVCCRECDADIFSDMKDAVLIDDYSCICDKCAERIYGIHGKRLGELIGEESE